MAGTTYGKPASLSSYYRCPHNWASLKHAADHPDHPRTVQAPKLLLDQVVGATPIPFTAKNRTVSLPAPLRSRCRNVQ